MSQRFEVYQCSKCGAMVEVLRGGGGKLTCCGKDMRLLKEKTADKTTEKHVPVVEKSGNGIVVKVGTVPHPMDDDHLIEWIEAVTDDGVFRKFLKPGAPPEVEFNVQESDVKSAREFCNKHGLWKS